MFPIHSHGNFIRIRVAKFLLFLCIQPFRDSIWGHLNMAPHQTLPDVGNQGLGIPEKSKLFIIN